MMRKLWVFAAVFACLAPLCTASFAQQSDQQAYDIEKRCLAFFSILGVLRKQHNDPADKVALTEQQTQFYKNALVADGAKLGKSADAAIDELAPYADARLTAYHTDKSAFDTDLTFCWGDWKQRLVARGPDGNGQ